ncbi:MAG: type II toxin-antitoxin system prevent-host-death family antitoxin [Mycobacterium sp.]
MVYAAGMLDRMEKVGVRQLRQNPTPVLQAVEAGAEVAVTVSGRVVARLVPFDAVDWVDGASVGQVFAAAVDDDWTTELESSRRAETLDDPWS